MDTQFNMPLLGDDFPELNVQTTHGPMSIPGDLKGSWFVLFSHPGRLHPGMHHRICRLPGQV